MNNAFVQLFSCVVQVYHWLGGKSPLSKDVFVRFHHFSLQNLYNSIVAHKALCASIFLYKAFSGLYTLPGPVQLLSIIHRRLDNFYKIRGNQESKKETIQITSTWNPPGPPYRLLTLLPPESTPLVSNQTSTTSPTPWPPKKESTTLLNFC